MTSKTPEWSTPWRFFQDLVKEFGVFDLDPCATPENAKAAKFFTLEDDGLSRAWAGRVFMNPPYGRTIGLWMKKAWESAGGGAHVVCLVPARTDTAWWHDYASKGDVRFIRGRLKFGDAKVGAPFPSALVIFRPRTG